MDVIDGAVPAEQLEEALGRALCDPPHPGQTIRGTSQRKSLTISATAKFLGVDRADLDRVLNAQAPVLPELALRLEAAGWATADFWVRLQSAYDLAQARRRKARPAA